MPNFPAALLKRCVSTAPATATATKPSPVNFRELLVRPASLQGTPPKPAFSLQAADYDAALEPLRSQQDTSLHIEPVLKQLTGLALQNRPCINQFNIQQACAAFARAPGDTGSPEVQTAITTVKMLYLGEHCAANKHDYKAQRRLVQLVGQRKAMLRYLRRISLDRFYQHLHALNLPAGYLDAVDPYPMATKKSKK